MWGEGLRGAMGRGGRRKWAIARTHQRIRVALMATSDASCWEVGGCDKNRDWPIGHTSYEGRGLMYMLPSVSPSRKAGYWPGGRRKNWARGLMSGTEGSGFRVQRMKSEFGIRKAES